MQLNCWDRALRAAGSVRTRDFELFRNNLKYFLEQHNKNFPRTPGLLKVFSQGLEHLAEPTEYKPLSQKGLR